MDGGLEAKINEGGKSHPVSFFLLFTLPCAFYRLFQASQAAFVLHLDTLWASVYRHALLHWIPALHSSAWTTCTDKSTRIKPVSRPATTRVARTCYAYTVQHLGARRGHRCG